jgi:hypothetical protein
MVTLTQMTPYSTQRVCIKHEWLQLKQEGNDGPEVAHLYIGPQSGASFNPRALFEQTW